MSIMRFLSCLQPDLILSELTTFRLLTLLWHAPLTLVRAPSLTVSHSLCLYCFLTLKCLGLAQQNGPDPARAHNWFLKCSPLSLSSECCSISILFHIINYLHRIILPLGLSVRSLITWGRKLGSPETDPETKSRVSGIYKRSTTVRGMGQKQNWEREKLNCDAEADCVGSSGVSITTIASHIQPKWPGLCPMWAVLGRCDFSMASLCRRGRPEWGDR